MGHIIMLIVSCFILYYIYIYIYILFQKYFSTKYFSFDTHETHFKKVNKFWG